MARTLLTTSASISVPRVTPTTPPATSLPASVSPPIVQPVPHVLSVGAASVSLVVHLYPIWTRGAASFWQSKLYVTAILSPVLISERLWRNSTPLSYPTTLETWFCNPPGANVVTDKWIFKHKFKTDRTLKSYKACWVLRGFTQHPSVDYDETSSPIVKSATVLTVMSLDLSRDWPVHQLDVKNAFLYGTLTETV
jgi:hypothetical protein